MKNKRSKRILRRILLSLSIIYVIGCSYMYFYQESFLFHPEKLKANHKFDFNDDFKGTYKELYFKMKDGVKLNGLLFKTEERKGLIFYLHGNAGSINNSGTIARDFTKTGYDLFTMDYRGFGKSGGEPESDKQLFKDVQFVYNQLKNEYEEENIIVLGYSMGTGLAAQLASDNNPREVILVAPYFSMVDMMQSEYPIIPTFLLNYPLRTDICIKKCSMPITLFHGTKDEVIPYNSSTRLNKLARNSRFITMKGNMHNEMIDQPKFLQELYKILK